MPIELQSCPDRQVPQALPLAPHSSTDCEPKGTHASLAQQPSAHVLGSQEQVPLERLQSPLLHGAHAMPALPHSVADWSE
jgi:hypothetical protein